MEFSAQTKLTDIIAAYPWLPGEMVKMDKRLAIINSPMGKMLIRNATLSDASARTGYPLDTIVSELEKLIAAHENQ